MAQRDVRIFGAGPAGASLAYMLKKETKWRIKVYETLQRPGMKPCGWAVPKEVEELVPIPPSAVLTTIRRVRVYLDGLLLYEFDVDGAWGYVVDKPKWLSHLLSGVPVEYRRRTPEFNAPQGSVRVIAVGHSYPKAPKERINAVQSWLRVSSWREVDTIEFWFDKNLVGYYWIFPHTSERVDVGVGGFKTFSELRGLLSSFIKRHPVLSSGEKINEKGASIIASGLKRELLNPEPNTYVVGEAAGAVFPLTGEGIRPSIMTSRALANALQRGTSYVDEVDRMGLFFSMKVHRILLEILRKVKPEQRAQVLKTMKGEWVLDFALGKFTRETLRAMLLNAGPYSKALLSIFTSVLQR